MLLRAMCAGLIALGGVVMAVSAVRYFRFVRQNRTERYDSIRLNRVMETLSMLVMVFFIIGYAVGFVDVVRRPVEPIYLFVATVFFVGGVFFAAMVQMQISLAHSLREKNLEVMRGFVNSIEMKDSYTKGHSSHVFHIVRLLYRELPAEMRHSVNESKLLDAALLHDIGKIGVSNEILNKQGPLSEAEWEAIHTHPRQGAQMLAGTCYKEIGEWVMYHHERMDGHGYYKLPGADVPLEARLLAVADTYSAMTTDREYRPHRSHEEAVQVLREVAGSQLDAQLVEAFCRVDGAELKARLEQVRLEAADKQG